MHFAKIEIQARRKESAKNRVHHHKREIVFVQPWHRDMTNAQLRLRRVCLVDDVHARLPIPRDIERLGHIGRGPTPIAEIFGRMTHGIVNRDIANHYQRCRIRTIVFGVIRLRSFARDMLDALLIAAGQSRNP